MKKYRLVLPKDNENLCCVKKLGSGGKGVVEMTIDNLNGSLNAVKKITLRNENDEEIFDKEVQNLQIFNKEKHFPRILYYEKKDNIGYIHMEYHCGDTLKSIIDSKIEIPLNIINLYIAQLLDGVETIHKMGFLHLDIKPENIIIEVDGNLVLIDLGSFIKNGEAVEFVQMSLLYVSPEVIKEEYYKINEKTDTWSIGMVALNLFLGYEFYKNYDIYQVQNIISQYIKNPHNFEKDILYAIIEKIYNKKLKENITTYELYSIIKTSSDIYFMNYVEFILKCLNINIDERPDISNIKNILSKKNEGIFHNYDIYNNIESFFKNSEQNNDQNKTFATETHDTMNSENSLNLSAITSTGI